MQIPSVSSAAASATSIPVKSTEESERRYTSLKSNVESRKTARKLVRPRLLKPEEPQGDTEMSEIEGPSNGSKPVPSSDIETQGNLSSLPVTQTVLRKRQVSSSDYGSREESVSQGETGPDVAAPLLKKPKGSESLQEKGEEQASAIMENIETLPAIEEPSDVGDLPQASNEEAIVDADKGEFETTGEKANEPKEPQLEEESQVDSQNDNNILEENLDKPGGKEMVSDDGAHDQADLENQPSMMEIGNDREEGELVPDAAELDGAGDAVGSSELAEAQLEPAVTPVASPARVDDEALASAAVDAGEIGSQDIASDEKNEEVDVPEETAEVSDKSNDGNDQTAVESDQVAEAASAITSVVPESTSAITTSEASVSKLGSPSVVAESEEARQVSPLTGASTTINLTERARQRAMLRQAGVVSPPGRGRGRGVPRGRGARGRRGRGPTPSEQA